MKRFHKAIMALCLITAFYSCKKDIGTTDAIKNDAISSSKKGDSIVHKLVINGNVNYVVEVNGTYFYADDITISLEQFNALKKLTATNLSTQERSTIVQDFAITWPNATVYFSYPDASTMTAAQYNAFVATINTATNNINAATGIQFQVRTTQTEYIRFVKSATANNSPFGWIPNRVNTINLMNYDHVGITIHEILHSLGVAHEQCRADRDLYVTIDLTKVQAGQQSNYNIFYDYAGHGVFDFGSIMMYSSNEFAIASNDPVMRKLDGTTFVGQRVALTAGDIAGLRSLYFPVEEGAIYNISPAHANAKSLLVLGNQPVNGANIAIWAASTSTSQKFIFRKAGHGYYQIKSLLDTTKVLTVRNAATASGTQVELSANSNTDNQKFKLLNRGDEGFRFAPKHASGLRLEVSGGGAADGTNVVVSTSIYSSAAQRFYLTKL